MSGLFGVASRQNCMDDLFYGTDYHSHLGTEFGGLAVQGNRIHRAIHRISRGQFKNLFDEFYRQYAGEMGVGVISDSNPQPIAVKSRFGVFTVVTAGLINNARELANELLAQGVTFNEVLDDGVNPTELVAKMIAQEDDIVRGAQRAFERVEGSVSLLLMTQQGIYAGADLNGRFPLSVASRDGTTAVASESCAFGNLGLTVQKYLQPGEVVFIDAEGLRRDTMVGEPDQRVCSFLWVYTGYPASSYEGVSVERVRERCGAALARKDTVEADLAAGVPDSGTGHAVGYAMESGLPFRRPLVKYSAGYGRSYIPPSQEVRDRIAKMKLIPIEDIARGQRIILCEDSIVRGTQLKNLTLTKLWNAGAREVHVRVACPPLMYPCQFSLSTRTKGELAARRAIRDLEGGPCEDIRPYLDADSDQYRRMVEWIRREINCTSLVYLSLEEMREAIGLPAADLCAHCWAGEAGA